MTDIITDLRQRHLEAFEAEYYRLKKDAPQGLNNDTGATVRAALKAGWLTENIDVGDMKPADVRKLAERINETYTEVITIDPNS